MTRFLTAAALATAVAFGAPAMAETPEENRQVILDYYSAYGSGDMNAVAEFFAEDIEWHIPGQHPLAGTKRAATRCSPSSSSSDRAPSALS